MTADSTARALPNGWSWRQLDEIAELLSGGTPPKNDASLWTGEVPWISPKDMKRHQLDRSADTIAADAARRFSRVVPAGTTLVVIRGMILARDIPVCLTLRPMAFNQDVKAIVPKAGIDGTYLSFAIASQKRPLQADIGTAAHGTRRIGSAALEKLKVPVPADRMEQSRIANALLTLLHRRELEASRLASLRALKAATMAKLFREGLGQEALTETPVGLLPCTWSLHPLAALAQLFSGGTPAKNRPDWWAGTVPWLSPKDMKTTWLEDTEDHITEEAIASGSRLVPANSIFVCVRGMALAKNIPISIGSVPMAFNQDVKAVIPRAGIDPTYLLYAIMAAKDRLRPEIGTSAHGTRRLGSASVEKLLIPLPANEREAREIGSILRKLDQEITFTQDRIQESRRLFSAVSAALLTGVLRVPSVPGELEAPDAS